MNIPADIPVILARVSILKNENDEEINDMIKILESIKPIEPNTIEKLFEYNQQLIHIKKIIYAIIEHAELYPNYKDVQNIIISKWDINPNGVKYEHETPQSIYDIWVKKKQGIIALKMMLQYFLNVDYQAYIFDIIEVIEATKSAILDEKEFISPFLSFNLFTKRLFMEEEFDTTKTNFIIIYRDHIDNNFYKLPNYCVIDTNVGITPAIIQNKYFKLPNIKTPKFLIKFIKSSSKTSKFIII